MSTTSPAPSGRAGAGRKWTVLLAAVLLTLLSAAAAIALNLDAAPDTPSGAGNLTATQAPVSAVDPTTPPTTLYVDVTVPDLPATTATPPAGTVQVLDDHGDDRRDDHSDDDGHSDDSDRLDDSDRRTGDDRHDDDHEYEGRDDDD